MKKRMFLGAFVLAVAIVLFAGLMSVSADPPIYWKPGGWIDYAPNGLPDFDQKQPGWGPLGFPPPWSYCGPVAVANSLWWFDSRYEPKPVAPHAVNDHYFLVLSYNPLMPGGWDDHDPQNVPPLVQELAMYFDTDDLRPPFTGPWLGTNILDMFYGLQWYLYGKPPASWMLMPRPASYYDDYYVTLKEKPPFGWVADEVLRSEDVILLLGFWQDYDPTPAYDWRRLGGHYVTVAGVDAGAVPPQIAFSDPYTDTAEVGAPGRTLNGTLIPHLPIPGHGPAVHNDAGNLSHDVYNVKLTPPLSPHGLWEIAGYPPYSPGDVTQNFEDQNRPGFPYNWAAYNPAFPIFTEVEYAIAMSPFHWKPGGEWVWVPAPWNMWEWWWYEDDGHSCLPDFSSGGLGYGFDGPVVIANSFWWFDSKYETLITGGWPQPPPTISDHYDLVKSYNAAWDDHDKKNITPLVQDLASYANTTSSGTTADGMVAGISNYLAGRNLLTDFYTKTMDAPSFEWVAHEVTMCEDVILLLGFWENTGTGYERKGGHYVNAAGVHVGTGGADRNLIGLSDPAMDNAVGGQGSGRVFEPEYWKAGFPDPINKGPTDISHDIYHIGSSPVSNGQWSLADYPVTGTVPSFVGLNGGGATWGGGALYTVVEWAMAVSPRPALDITKTAVMDHVVPGGWITYTIGFSNVSPYTVTNVTINDPLPATTLMLGTSSFASAASPGVSINHVPSTYYSWNVSDLGYNKGGTITITAQVNPEINIETLVVTNTVFITGTNLHGPKPEGTTVSDAAEVIMRPSKMQLPIIMKNHPQ